jgi:hypothetical protein
MDIRAAAAAMTAGTISYQCCLGARIADTCFEPGALQQMEISTQNQPHAALLAIAA